MNKLNIILSGIVMRNPFFLRRQLHIIAENYAEVFVIADRQRHEFTLKLLFNSGGKNLLWIFIFHIARPRAELGDIRAVVYLIFCHVPFGKTPDFITQPAGWNHSQQNPAAEAHQPAMVFRHGLCPK